VTHVALSVLLCSAAILCAEENSSRRLDPYELAWIRPIQDYQCDRDVLLTLPISKDAMAAVEKLTDEWIKTLENELEDYRRTRAFRRPTEPDDPIRRIVDIAFEASQLESDRTAVREALASPRYNIRRALATVRVNRQLLIMDFAPSEARDDAIRKCDEQLSGVWEKLPADGTVKSAREARVLLEPIVKDCTERINALEPEDRDLLNRLALEPLQRATQSRKK
jgi:hypothetical protein